MGNPRISSGWAAACLGISKYRTPQQLQRELLELPDPEPEPDHREVNNPLVFGHLLEATVVEAGRRMFEARLIEREGLVGGIEAFHLGGTTGRDEEWVHPDLPMSGHPDAIYRSWDGRQWLVDAKTTSLWEEYDVENDDPPPDVYVQGMHLWELGRVCAGPLEPVVLVPVFRRGRRFDPFCLVEIPVDQDLVARLVEAEKAFLETYVLPSLAGQDVPVPEPTTFEEMKRVKVDGTGVQLSEELAAKMTEMLEARAAKAAAEKREKELLAQLLPSIGAAEVICGPGGPLAKYTTQVKTFIDVAELRRSMPDVAERFSRRQEIKMLRRWK